MKISDLKNMRVVNLANGKFLGKITDLIMDVDGGYIKAIILPGGSKWPVFFGDSREMEVPWKNIMKIGQDVIIVDVPEVWTQKE